MSTPARYSPAKSLSIKPERLSVDSRRKIGWFEEVFEKGKPGVCRLYTSKYKDYPLRRIRRFGEDEDIAEEILKLARSEGYRYFDLERMSSRKEAFKRSCGLWHCYRDELDNSSHPRRPEGMESDVSCPQCNDYQYELF